jgi:hypothetical protein
MLFVAFSTASRADPPAARASQTSSRAAWPVGFGWLVIIIGVEPTDATWRPPKLAAFRPSERVSSAPEVSPTLCPKKRRREMGRIMCVSWTVSGGVRSALKLCCWRPVK